MNNNSRATACKECLLFVFPIDEPKAITDNLRHEFPDIEVVFHKLNDSVKNARKAVGGIPYPSHDSVPAGLWHRATILVTLASLPPTIEAAPHLKYIHLLSAGIDSLSNHPFITDTDIPITTSSGIAAPAIAEWIVMSTLVLNKSYNLMHDNQKKKKWDSNAPQLMNKADWNGKVVGICGYGSIGRQTARVFAGLGSSIHAFTASPRSTPEARKDTGYIPPHSGDPDGTIPTAWYSGHTRSDLHTFLASGLDLLVVSVPLTEATRGLFGEEEFEVIYKASKEKMQQKGETSDQLPPGDGCIFVNVSRGQIVQTDALTKALDGKLQGAALDVTDPEPLPENSPLWNIDNVVIAPHISGLFRGYLPRAFEVLKENLKRREQHQPLLNEVNRRLGY